MQRARIPRVSIHVHLRLVGHSEKQRRQVLEAIDQLREKDTPDQCPLAVLFSNSDWSEETGQVKAQRVRWMAEPATLVQSLLERLDECGALVPAVHKALEKAGRA